LSNPLSQDCLSKKLVKKLTKQKHIFEPKDYVSELVMGIKISALEDIENTFNSGFGPIVRRYIDDEYKLKGNIKAFKGIIKS
jgi:hypothetical protein